MTDVVIRVENLSKQYRIGGPQAEYRTIRETLTGAVQAPIRRLASVARGQSSAEANETIWALKDVSFEVKQGEVLGIIGRNGAGKTTLLKILSRITAPTRGTVDLFGRVGSLLEVGTGFHPELTGRENIYLNGAILGMRRSEIERKFDEMVAFAEIEKFLDTPVKHYSSGMYVRLAFAVAAHLEPEILLVDEVLAVGDAAFQKKCLGKMGEVAKEGRTVLFVSHNMAAINRLCCWALWLDAGRPQMLGSAESVVAAYLSTGAELEGERRWEDLKEAPGNEKIRLQAVRILNSDGLVSSTVDVRHPFHVEIEYDILQPLMGAQVGFWLLTSDGVVVFVAGDNEDQSWVGRPRKPGRHKSTCKVPALLLNGGLYTLTVASDLRNTELLFVTDDALRFHVEQTLIPAHSHQRPAGVICPFLEWQVRRIDAEE
jgi:lipopolysaccharide transport system ATP-binding protein